MVEDALNFWAGDDADATVVICVYPLEERRDAHEIMDIIPKISLLSVEHGVSQ